MKQRAFVFGFAVLIVGTGLWAVLEGKATPSVAPTPPVAAALPVGVETLMKSALRYTGTIRVEGVVSAVSTETRTLGLIDVREAEECKELTCAEVTLPVYWEGKMPEPGDKVLAAGRVDKIEGKFLFVATELDVVAPQAIGAG